jgi:hypothetical protein
MLPFVLFILARAAQGSALWWGSPRCSPISSPQQSHVSLADIGLRIAHATLRAQLAEIVEPRERISA